MDNNFSPIHDKLDYKKSKITEHQYDIDKFDKFDRSTDNEYAGGKYYENGYAELIANELQSDPTPIMLEFFSNKNIERIQKKIRREIFNQTNKKYILDVDQDVLDLVTAMGAVYKEHSKELPSKTIRQVKKLNDQTVQYVVPDMITAIKQYYGYLRDIQNPPRFLDNMPLNVSSAGRKQLRSVTTLWQ